MRNGAVLTGRWADRATRLLHWLDNSPLPKCKTEGCRRSASGWIYPPDGGWQKAACERHIRHAKRAGIPTEYWVE